MTEATWVTVVVTVFGVLGSGVFPRLSWNETVPLLPITVPAVTPALTVTVNCRDPEPPATIAPMLQVTTPPVRVPPPVALWNVVLDGTKSESETLVAPTLPALLYESVRSEEHTSELQSRLHLVCRLLLEKKKKKKTYQDITRSTCK